MQVVQRQDQYFVVCQGQYLVNLAWECYDVPALLQQKRVQSVLVEDVSIRVNHSYFIFYDNKYGVSVHGKLNIIVIVYLRNGRQAYR